jgi:hypothetical protein
LVADSVFGTLEGFTDVNGVKALEDERGEDFSFITSPTLFALPWFVRVVRSVKVVYAAVV